MELIMVGLLCRCEELQLELASSQRSRPVVNQQNQATWGGKGGEIERIMAKIEQDNRILAELDHSRSTTLGAGLATSASSHALGECSPPISPITMSHTTPSIYPASSSLGGHNTSYPTQGHSLGYLPTNTSYNPTSISSQFNPYKSNLMTHTLGQYGTLGQTSALGPTSVLATTGLTHSGLSSTIGTLGTSLGTSMVPPVSYTTNPATFTSPLITNNPTALSQAPYTNPVTSTLNQYTLPGTYNPVTTSFTNNVTFSNPLSSQFNSMPLSGPVGMSIKLKPLEEVELGNHH